MRTSLSFILSLALLAGCKDNSLPNPSQMVTRNAENTWTSDALQRGDIEAIRERTVKDSSYVDQRDYIGNTPLLTAIEFGNFELVRFLLKHGADPNVEVDDGYTCLLTATESEKTESPAIVRELIRFGANIHTIGIHGWTPLHMAAARGKMEIARLLIDAGADVNRRKEIDGSETPLMEAAYHRRTRDYSPFTCTRR